MRDDANAPLAEGTDNDAVVEELLLQVGDAWRVNLEIKDYDVRLRRQDIGDTGKF